MRKFVLAVALIGLASAVAADPPVQVRGYFKADGTYVEPHVRSAPNNTTADNWTTAPNINPYTGTQGTRQPAPASPTLYTPPAKPTKPPCYFNCK